MRSVARTAYRCHASLFLVGVIAEFFLAELDVFRTQTTATRAGATLTTAASDHRFEPHPALGDTAPGVLLDLVPDFWDLDYRPLAALSAAPGGDGCA